MSIAVKKFRELYGEFEPKFVNDPYICGFPHMIAATYTRLKNAIKGYRIEKTMEISFAYDREQYNHKGLKCLSFNGKDYNELFIHEALRVLNGVSRVEQWVLDGKDEDGKPLVIFSLVMVDKSNDCVMVAEVLAPGEKYHDDEFNMDIITEKHDVVLRIEDLSVRTFDPFEF